MLSDTVEVLPPVPLRPPVPDTVEVFPPVPLRPSVPDTVEVLPPVPLRPPVLELPPVPGTLPEQDGHVPKSGVQQMLLLLPLACSRQALDAGSDSPHGLLPVDERNAVIICNDNQSDNWQGVYAVLFANSGGPALAGIIVNTTKFWPDLNTNVADWQKLVTAARASGLAGIPDPVASGGSPLVRPNDGNLDATAPNRSAGALLIVETSARLGLPNRPLVVATGGPLTDVADAYLIDRTVTERVVVVSTLGSASAKGGSMGSPNGTMDPWADWIVAQRFRYIQVSTYYDQTTDVTSSQVSELPQNPLGSLIADQQSKIINLMTASDQIGIIAVGLPKFVTAIENVSQDPSSSFDSTTGPNLVPDARGRLTLVTGSDCTFVTARLWQMLQDSRTFGP